MSKWGRGSIIRCVRAVQGGMVAVQSVARELHRA